MEEYSNTFKVGAGSATADPTFRAGKRRDTTRLLTLAHLDRRCAAYRTTKELIDSIESDLGGADRLSTGERQLIQHGAVLGAVLEDLEARWIAGAPLDMSSFCTIVNAQRRVLEAVGLRRVPRDVTPKLSSYLAGAHTEAAE
jgi:hypothetical protein